MFVLLPLSFLYFVFVSTATCQLYLYNSHSYLFARYVGNRVFYKQVSHQNEKEKWEGTAALQWENGKVRKVADIKLLSKVSSQVSS